VCRVSLLAFDPQYQRPVSADHVLEGILTTSVEPDGLAKFSSLKLLPDISAATTSSLLGASSPSATYYCLEFQLFALPAKQDPLGAADAFSIEPSCPLSTLRARSLLIRSPFPGAPLASSSRKRLASELSTSGTLARSLRMQLTRAH
jgi:hypothetical protein